MLYCFAQVRTSEPTNMGAIIPAHSDCIKLLSYAQAYDNYILNYYHSIKLLPYVLNYYHTITRLY